MVEELSRAIEELEVPAGGDALAAAFALADRLEAKLVAAVGDFDASGEWAAEGATSTTAWLKHRTRRSGREACGLVARARTLRSLPVTARAWLDGALSGAQVGAVAANVVGEAALARFAEHEATVVPALAELSVPDTVLAMRHWALGAEAVGEGEADERPSALGCHAPWVTVGTCPVTSVSRTGPCWPPPWAWPSHPTSTVSRPGRRRCAGPMPWSTSAASSSTTSAGAEAGATGPT